MRKIISLTAFLSFLLLLLTSFVLLIMPHGRVTYWANWTFWGLAKDEWDALHLNLGLLFLAVGLWHTVLNWGAIVRYLSAVPGKLLSPSFHAALLITLSFCLGTYLQVVPFSWGPELAGWLKERGTRIYGDPPYGHAELSPLSMLVRNTGLDAEAVRERIDAEKLVIVSWEAPVKELAAANGLSPQQFFERLQPAVVPGQVQPLPPVAPVGIGKRPLAEICRQYDLPVEAVVRMLEQRGFPALQPQWTLKDMASRYETTPMAVYEQLHRVSLELVPGR
ncbi:MAG: DUF4405 domain-containing protein [Desulfuromonadaceae bacterium]|nr:DUF4405 domain-containing protein [Desulfuromonadaceae bacterium]